METAQVHIKRAKRDRLKVKAARERKTMFEALDEAIDRYLSAKKI